MKIARQSRKISSVERAAGSGFLRDYVSMAYGGH